MKAQITFTANVPDIATRFKNYSVVANALILHEIAETEQTACKHAIDYIFCGFDFELTFNN